MAQPLHELIRAAKKWRKSSLEREAQRVSFVYGNANVEGEAVSRAAMTVVVGERDSKSK